MHGGTPYWVIGFVLVACGGTAGSNASDAGTDAAKDAPGLPYAFVTSGFGYVDVLVESNGRASGNVRAMGGRNVWLQDIVSWPQPCTLPAPVADGCVAQSCTDVADLGGDPLYATGAASAHYLGVAHAFVPTNAGYSTLTLPLTPAGGEPVRFETSGALGGAPSFAIDAPAPSELDGVAYDALVDADGALQIDGQKGLAVTWTPAPSGDAIIAVYWGFPLRVYCSFPITAGKGTVPAAAFADVPKNTKNPHASIGALSGARVHASSHGFEVDLWLRRYAKTPAGYSIIVQ